MPTQSGRTRASSPFRSRRLRRLKREQASSQALSECRGSPVVPTQLPGSRRRHGTSASRPKQARNQGRGWLSVAEARRARGVLRSAQLGEVGGLLGMLVPSRKRVFATDERARFCSPSQRSARMQLGSGPVGRVRRLHGSRRVADGYEDARRVMRSTGDVSRDSVGASILSQCDELRSASDDGCRRRGYAAPVRLFQRTQSWSSRTPSWGLY
jgi:hypothetical protein